MIVQANELMAGTFGDSLGRLLEGEPAAVRAAAGLALRSLLLTAEVPTGPANLPPGDETVAETIAVDVAASMHRLDPPEHVTGVVYELLLTPADVRRVLAEHEQHFGPFAPWSAAADQAIAELRAHPDHAGFAVLTLTSPCPHHRQDPTA